MNKIVENMVKKYTNDIPWDKIQGKKIDISLENGILRGKVTGKKGSKVFPPMRIDKDPMKAIDTVKRFAIDCEDL